MNTEREILKSHDVLKLLESKKMAALEDIYMEFSDLEESYAMTNTDIRHAIRGALCRLVAEGRIYRVCRGIYATFPDR